MTAVTVSGESAKASEGRPMMSPWKVKAHDLPAAIAEHGGAVQPARADDEKLARGLALANDHRPAPADAVLLLEPVESLNFGFREAHILAEPLG